jgi:uncharacterized circularly permuted ATP-grasp superfamily protein
VTGAGGAGVAADGGSAADPVAEYHALLADRQLAADTHGQLVEQMGRRGLIFGERALCSVLRPRLLAPWQHRYLQRRTAGLARAFRRAHEAAVASAEVRAQLRLADWEEAFAAADLPGVPSPTSRVDAFVTWDHGREGGDVWVTEYNAETPAGGGYNDALVETFLDLPVMREFAKRWSFLPVSARHGISGALLDAWQQWSGTRAVPRIAILDWPDVPTWREFEMFQAHFAQLGIDCVIDDPRNAELRDGGLWVGGARVDVIYKRVLLSELVDELGPDNVLFRAVRERRVCMVNDPRCKLMHKKASLAVLGDERNAHLFDPAMLEAIRASVPWTRVLEERHTEHAGERVDLLPWARANRERLVLKPNDDYGGAGIVLGWTVDEGAWEHALAEALTRPYVVQERVPVPSEPYPSWVDGELAVVDRMLDTAPFVIGGTAVEGLLTRLSTAALLNVTAGGGSQVPNFVVESRA